MPCTRAMSGDLDIIHNNTQHGLGVNPGDGFQGRQEGKGRAGQARQDSARQAGQGGEAEDRHVDVELPQQNIPFHAPASGKL